MRKRVAHLEAGHVADLPTYATCRGRCEVEAESIAYMVATAQGMHASGYSFAYVAGWAGGDLSIVRQAGDTVIRTARRILTPLDAAPGQQEHVQAGSTRAS